MVRIRLRRMGLKRQPLYRIVVTDQRKARNGHYIEVIGHHNPRTEPSPDGIQEDRALYWLSVGAQPSDAVRRIMERTGTMERLTRLHAGESMEDLVAEAEENAPELPPQTTAHPAPAPMQGKGPRAKERAEAAAEVEAAGEEAAE